MRNTIFSVKPMPRVLAPANIFATAQTLPTGRRGQNSKAFHKLGILFVALLALSVVARAQDPWVKVTDGSLPTALQGQLGLALQLTDGAIMVQENKTPNWWILTPDNMGHYNTGTWSTTPVQMPAGYGPTYFASAVLPDGRVIVEGGENNLGKHAETSLGAIYDPMTKK